MKYYTIFLIILFSTILSQEPGPVGEINPNPQVNDTDSDDDTFDNTTAIINMCGKVGQLRPTEPEECTKDSIEFGGECCYVKFKNNATSFTACISVLSTSKRDFELAENAAGLQNYTISVICSSMYIKVTNLLISLIVINLL